MVFMLFWFSTHDRNRATQWNGREKRKSIYQVYHFYSGINFAMIHTCMINKIIKMFRFERIPRLQHDCEIIQKLPDPNLYWRWFVLKYSTTHDIEHRQILSGKHMFEWLYSAIFSDQQCERDSLDYMFHVCVACWVCSLLTLGVPAAKWMCSVNACYLGDQDLDKIMNDEWNQRTHNSMLSGDVLTEANYEAKFCRKSSLVHRLDTFLRLVRDVRIFNQTIVCILLISLKFSQNTSDSSSFHPIAFWCKSIWSDVCEMYQHCSECCWELIGI